MPGFDSRTQAWWLSLPPGSPPEKGRWGRSCAHRTHDPWAVRVEMLLSEGMRRGRGGHRVKNMDSAGLSYLFHLLFLLHSYLRLAPPGAEPRPGA